MNRPNCPRCGIKMKRRSRKNISEDYCPKCGMIFGYIRNEKKELKEEKGGDEK